MISAPAQSALAELNEIVGLDGAVLHVVDASPTSIRLELDLSASTCPECVVPKDLMLDILGASLAKADPDVVHVELHDPREGGERTFVGPLGSAPSSSWGVNRLGKCPKGTTSAPWSLSDIRSLSLGFARTRHDTQGVKERLKSLVRDRPSPPRLSRIGTNVLLYDTISRCATQNGARAYGCEALAKARPASWRRSKRLQKTSPWEWELWPTFWTTTKAPSSER